MKRGLLFDNCSEYFLPVKLAVTTVSINNEEFRVSN